MKKYIVQLSPDEREMLKKFLKSGKGSASSFDRARILLKADQSDEGPAWSDGKIHKALDVPIDKVERVRKKYTLKGLKAVLFWEDYKKKFDSKVEAQLLALSRSAPPGGRTRWTLRLLAKKMVELGYVDSISYESVRQLLNK